MAAETTEITYRSGAIDRSYLAEMARMSDRELLETIYVRVLEVERMYLAWQAGGLRGLRQARRV